MERLTEKVNNKHCAYDIKKGQLCNAFEKLGQLEDIEEEYGIGLITFFDEIKDTRIEEFIREIIATIKRRKENEQKS